MSESAFCPRFVHCRRNQDCTREGGSHGGSHGGSLQDGGLFKIAQLWKILGEVGVTHLLRQRARERV